MLVYARQARTAANFRSATGAFFDLTHTDNGFTSSVVPLEQGASLCPLSLDTSGSLPDLVKNPRGDFGLVLWQETTVVLGDHLGSILDRIAGLFVGTGLFQDMRCQNIPHIVGAVRQEPFDRAAIRPWIVDAVALDHRKRRLNPTFLPWS